MFAAFQLYLNTLNANMFAAFQLYLYILNTTMFAAFQLYLYTLDTNMCAAFQFYLFTLNKTHIQLLFGLNLHKQNIHFNVKITAVQTRNEKLL